MPVVNPWIFYLMSMVDKIQLFLIIGAVFLVVLLVITALAYAEKDFNVYFEDEKKQAEEMKKDGKKTGLSLAIVIIILTLLPSSETIGQMLIAKNVTYERVETTVDVVTDVYEDIMALFNQSQNNS